MTTLPAVGSLTLIENEKGGFNIDLQFNTAPETDPEILSELQNALYGLSYLMSQDSGHVVYTGEVYKHGISAGLATNESQVRALKEINRRTKKSG